MYCKILDQLPTKKMGNEVKTKEYINIQRNDVVCWFFLPKIPLLCVKPVQSKKCNMIFSFFFHLPKIKGTY